MDKESNICQICGIKNPNNSHFWKSHALKQSDYYTQYFPRYSKTGKPIPFKNKEQYFESEFVDKNELKDWVKNAPELAVDYLISFLSKRYELKKNIYLPSQIESRTLLIPSITYIDNKLIKYNKLAAKTKLKKRFNYSIKEELEFIKTINRHTIIQDTREQKGLSILKKEERAALKFGDYSCSRNPYNIYIERKSLSDFISSIGMNNNYERFQREIDRAKKNKSYLFIICEATFNDLAGFKHGRKFRGKVSFGPDFIFHRIRELMQKYKNIQFIFSGSRENSSKLIEKLFAAKFDPSKYDWQFLIDSKIIGL